ncbi:MAG: acyl transferase domain-containing protein/acyl carrier protein [Arenicella sp.]|jgi:acyl transferase domain-containing protein/acyl carrier protein
MEQKDDTNSTMMQALLAIDSLEQKIQKLEAAKHEPIAIVGMSCRLPGSSETPDQFWDLLINARSGIVSDDDTKCRWSREKYVASERDEVGKTVTLNAGFIDEYDRFDTGYFGLAPREVETMDPQQRLSLELSFAAIENAGYPVEQVSGQNIGVYLGVGANEYSRLCLASDNEDAGFFVTGNTQNVISGRVAYALGIHGPCMAIDTACSSSLVAVHTAVQALRNNECDSALAGGVNLLVDPTTFVSLSRANMLSEDGQCKTFDEHANGYVRGEGGGVLMLKKLSKAKQDGDHILALIRGSAVNQDGRSSSLTAPNGTAQRSVLRKALEDAGLSAESVSYIETHGTGTPLGDPIEVNSIKDVYCRGRQGKPLALGALKTNIGHLEAASGVASLVKVIMSLQHQQIPQNLNFNQLNPKLEIDETGIYFPEQATAWESPQSELIAGVSSFGFSGTNSHILLSQAPRDQQPKPDSESETNILVVSAKSAESLGRTLQRFETFFQSKQNLKESEYSVHDVCCSSVFNRSHHAYRHAFVIDSFSDAAQQIEAFLASKGTHKVALRKPRIGFMFTGQGAQYVGMAKQLYLSEPAFKLSFDECLDTISDLVDCDFSKIIWSDDSELLNQTQYTQPALFAVEYSLAKLWQSWGITPDCLIGHSVGEIVAACIAGVFSLHDGLKLITTRGKLMQALPNDGGMLVVMTSKAEVVRIADLFDVDIAAYNTATQYVVSGPLSQLENIKAYCQEHQITTFDLPTSHAFHSRLMKPVLNEFKAVCESINFTPPAIALLSNVTAEFETDQYCQAQYWADHILKPVVFSEGIAAFSERVDIVIEIGPKPTLTNLAKKNIDSATDIIWTPSLRGSKNDLHEMYSSLANVFKHGGKVNWQTVYSEGETPLSYRRKVALPTTAYVRHQYWVGQPSSIDSHVLSSTQKSHPLLGARLTLPRVDTIVYQSALTASSPGYLEHHRLFDMVIVPGASHISMVIAGIQNSLKYEACTLNSVVFHQTIGIPDEQHRMAQMVLLPNDDQLSSTGNVAGRFEVLSSKDQLSELESSWVTNATGHYSVASSVVVHSDLFELDSVVSAIAEVNEDQSKHQESGQEFYARIWESGYTLGSAFTWIGDYFIDSKRDLAIHRMVMPDLPDDQQVYPVYPGFLDSCFQAFGSSVELSADEDDIYIPFSLEKMSFFEQPDSSNDLWCVSRSRLNASNDDSRFIGDLIIVDSVGRIFFEITGLELRKSSQKLLKNSLVKSTKEESHVYQNTWQPIAVDTSLERDGAVGKWLIFTDTSPNQQQQECLDYLLDGFADQGIDWMRVTPGESCQRINAQQFVIVADEPQSYDTLLSQIGDEPIAGVVNLWPLNDIDSVESDQLIHSCLRSGALAQALSKRVSEHILKLVFITQNGQRLLSSDRLNDNQHALWSLGKVLRVEKNNIATQFIDLDEHVDDELLMQLSEFILSTTPQSELMLRDSQCYSLRLNAIQNTPHDSSLDQHLSADKTYVLTGGLGGIGFETVLQLLIAGAQKIALLVRRDLSTDQQKRLKRYLDAGAQVVCYHCDLGDSQAIEQTLSKITSQQSSIGGVLHVAGAVDDQFIESQTIESYSNVFTPKVSPVQVLDRVTRTGHCDFFICFSSIAGSFGTPGQANYAVANAYLDAVCQNRMAEGYAGLSIAWGPWDEVGMAMQGSDKKPGSKMREVGMIPMLLADGLSLISDAIITSAVGQPSTMVYAEFDWPVFLQRFPGAEINAYFSQMREQFLPQQQQRGELLRELEAQAVYERSVMFENQVKSVIVSVLKVASIADVSVDMGFFDSGMDSLMSLEFRQKLEKGYDIVLPPTVSFNYPTVGSLMAHLKEDVLTINFDVTQENESTADEQLETLSEDDLAQMLTEQLTAMTEV